MMPKKVSILLSALCLSAAAPTTVLAQEVGDFQLKTETRKNPENTPRPVFPVPSERQMKWNETEFYAFFHYGMNTYTNLEWGNGDEKEEIFAPTKVPNPEQWLTAAKAAGMQGGIAVIKHHDGFCLWPTSTTTHNVTSSSNSNAKQTNIPRDFSAAAKKLNMKYGFYISPWDRNSAYWGEKDKDGNLSETPASSDKFTYEINEKNGYLFVKSSVLGEIRINASCANGSELKETVKLNVNRQSVSLFDIVMFVIGLYLLYSAISGRGRIFDAEFVKEGMEAKH